MRWIASWATAIYITFGVWILTIMGCQAVGFEDPYTATTEFVAAFSFAWLMAKRLQRDAEKHIMEAR